MEKYKRENIEFLGEVSNEDIKTLILSSMAFHFPKASRGATNPSV